MLPKSFQLAYGYIQQGGTPRTAQLIVYKCSEEGPDNRVFYFFVFDNRPMHTLQEWYKDQEGGRHRIFSTGNLEMSIL